MEFIKTNINQLKMCWLKCVVKWDCYRL